LRAVRFFETNRPGPVWPRPHRGGPLPPTLLRPPRLARRYTTVDNQIVTIHIAGLVTGEEQSCVCDVLGMNHSGHGLYRRQHGRETGFDAAEGAIRCVSVDTAMLAEDACQRRPRRNRVDPNALLTKLECCTPCQMDQRCLCNLIAEGIKAGSGRAHT